MYPSVCDTKPKIKTSCIPPSVIQSLRSKPRIFFRLGYTTWDQNLVYLPSGVQNLRSKPRVFFCPWYNAGDQDLVYSFVHSAMPKIKTSYILPPETHYQDQNLAHDQTGLEICISIVVKFTSNLTIFSYFPWNYCNFGHYFYVRKNNTDLVYPSICGRNPEIKTSFQKIRTS